MALEAAYLMDSYPSDDQYKKLGTSLQLTSVQVREWFCKRRKKTKDAVILGTEEKPAKAFEDLQRENAAAAQT